MKHKRTRKPRPIRLKSTIFSAAAIAVVLASALTSVIAASVSNTGISRTFQFIFVPAVTGVVAVILVILIAGKRLKRQRADAQDYQNLINAVKSVRSFEDLDPDDPSTQLVAALEALSEVEGNPLWNPEKNSIHRAFAPLVWAIFEVAEHS